MFKKILSLQKFIVRSELIFLFCTQNKLICLLVNFYKITIKGGLENQNRKYLKRNYNNRQSIMEDLLYKKSKNDGFF